MVHETFNIFDAASHCKFKHFLLILHYIYTELYATSLKMEIIVDSIDRIPDAAAQFIASMGDDTLFAFYGEMGVGKTTFITEVCRQLGASEDSGSPTFSIVNEYSDSAGNPIYHFDFYRLGSPQEALDIGAEDYFYSGNLCFMEWPERIGRVLPEETVKVSVNLLPDERRIIKW